MRRSTTILKVCIHPTIQQALSLRIAVGDEGIIRKSSIVGMIMEDFITEF